MPQATYTTQMALGPSWNRSREFARLGIRVALVITRLEARVYVGLAAGRSFEARLP